MLEIEYFLSKDVRPPERGTGKSAGLDFYTPKSFKKTTIEPNQSILIELGIYVKLPEYTVLIAFNKSGVATKKGLIVGACVIDEDYQGEIKLHLINTSNKVVIIEPDEKIIQFLLLDANYPTVTQKNSIEQLYNNKLTERACGGFGSTDTIIPKSEQ